MNKKLIFTLIIICFAIISISGVNAIWPFDSGSDVTVNGVNFHIPEGFNNIKENIMDTNANYEAYTYKNDENHEFISISVLDSDVDKQSLYDSLGRKWYSHKIINGKDGMGKMYPNGPRYGYAYVENNKYVMIDIPFVYAEEGLQHEELLSELIK